MTGAQFRPGDRVQCVGTVRRDGGDGWFSVVLDGEDASTSLPGSALRSLPTPATKLRDAAEVLVRDCGWSDEEGHILYRLYRMADQLDAQAATPPPTLAEALDAYLAGLDQNGTASPALLGALREAREREKGA